MLRQAIDTLEPLEARQLLTGTLVQIQWDHQAVSAYQGQYLAYAKPGSNFQGLAQKLGFSNVQSLGADGYYAFDSTYTVPRMQRWARNYQSVVQVSPNALVKPASVPEPVPADPDYIGGLQWHLNNYGQMVQVHPYPTSVASLYPPVYERATAGADIKAPDAWGLLSTITQPNAQQVVVGIMDTGIDPNHPDLVNSLWTNPGEVAGNSLDDDNNGYADDVHGWNFGDNNSNLTDYVGHGTHVSGIAAGNTDNGIGIAGVAWNPNPQFSPTHPQFPIMPLKIADASGNLSLRAIVAGLNYAVTMKQMYNATLSLPADQRRGANLAVINASFGGMEVPVSRVEVQALQRLNEAGIVFVAAAGNSALNVDVNQTYPAKLGQTLANVITVAATDKNDNLASFSNFGEASALLGAPGVDIFSTVPTYPTPDATTTSYDYMSGTSMAAPVVTGVVALMKAAVPDATPLQIRQALMDGVDPVAQLGANIGGPRAVVTGGRVNAYKSMLALMNHFVTRDTSTGGNWRGSEDVRAFGTELAYVAGDTQQPAGLSGTIGTGGAIGTYSVSGAGLLAPKPSRRDGHNLQNPQTTGSAKARVAGALITTGQMTWNFNFTDGLAHRVTFYVHDALGSGGSETFEVYDPSSGYFVTGQYPQNVQIGKNGQYLTYELRGQESVRVSAAPGSTAQVNAFFVDPAPTQPLIGRNVDASGGYWPGVAGSQGAYVVGQTRNTPSFVTLTISPGAKVVRLSPSSRPAGVQSTTSGTARLRNYLASTGTMTLDFNFLDGQVHRTTFYAADFENAGRSERIDVVDPGTGAVRATQDLGDFASGKYVAFDLQGHEQVRITRLAGKNAVLSAVLFDAAPQQSAVDYIGVDSTTHGNWKGVYGSSGAYMPYQLSPSNPYGTQLANGSFFTLTKSNVQLQVIQPSTSNPNAPLKIPDAPVDRILARDYNRNWMMYDLNFGDSLTHRLAVYMLDNDTPNRRYQLVQLQDPVTGKVLAEQRVGGFHDGKYLVFDVRGPVRMVIYRLAGPSAVVNGIYVD